MLCLRTYNDLLLIKKQSHQQLSVVSQLFHKQLHTALQFLYISNLIFDLNGEIIRMKVLTKGQSFVKHRGNMLYIIDFPNPVGRLINTSLPSNAEAIVW